MRLRVYSLWTLLMVIFLTGCGHPVVRPQFADLISDNVVIHAKDGSWSFVANDPFIPSVVYDDAKMPVNVLSKDLSLYDHQRYKDSVIDVIVEVNNNEKLYGKILFSNVFERSGSNSAKRKWTVGVSEQYLNIARNGNVAVVYQPYMYNKRQWASWALWMSSLPL